MQNNFSYKIQKYLKNVSHAIPNDYPNKKSILTTLEKNLTLYFQEHPHASWNDFLAEFGSEKDILSSIMDEYSNDSIHIHMSKTEKKITCISIICLLAIFFCIITFLFIYWWENLKPPVIKPTHYIFDGTEVSSEEFEKRMNEN